MVIKSRTKCYYFELLLVTHNKRQPTNNLKHWISVVGPNDFYEWGDVSLSDVKEYNYHQIEWDAQQSSSYPSKISSQSTLATTLNVDHNDEDNDIRTQKNQKQLRPILMLGCGNSKLGEEMIEQGGFKGPIIQVDVSRPVVENMRQRCSDLVSNGSMSFVQVCNKLSRIENGC